jgi:drug/metabolite transporter (DMT)-like permease
LLAALALGFNAFVWGVSWWPFRHLQSHGLHPLWSTVFIYLVAVAVIGCLRPRAFGQVLRTPALWVLVLAAGTTNAAFNWGVAIGDVVRVVLLFYLMPLWVAVLARLMLHEAFTRMAGVRVVLALAGAAIVLQPDGGGWPLPQSLPDWLGVMGGFSFALNNVMLRREARRPEEQRALAMFLGGALVAGTLATGLTVSGRAGWPPMPTAGMFVVGGTLTAFFLLSNLALQYGAARLPANVSSVVMLGGGLILAAALLASLQRPATEGSSAPAT